MGVVCRPGGSCAVADDGSMVCEANSDGEEEMVTAAFADLYRLPKRPAPSWAAPPARAAKL